MATSKPASARDKAMARPRRLAPPVTSAARGMAGGIGDVMRRIPLAATAAHGEAGREVSRSARQGAYRCAAGTADQRAGQRRPSGDRADRRTTRCADRTARQGPLLRAVHVGAGGQRQKKQDGGGKADGHVKSPNDGISFEDIRSTRAKRQRQRRLSALPPGSPPSAGP